MAEQRKFNESSICIHYSLIFEGNAKLLKGIIGLTIFKYLYIVLCRLYNIFQCISLS